jgi:hypothetical protein
MVRAVMIVEMAGRPASHLRDKLEEHVGILKKVNDIEVNSIQISDTKEIENNDCNRAEYGKNKKMFTVFAECDFETASFARLSETMFDFMPSSVEVTDPSELVLDTNEATDLLNNISGRMHRYDEIAKIASVKLAHADRQLMVMKELLKEKERDIVALKGEKKG